MRARNGGSGGLGLLVGLLEIGQAIGDNRRERRKNRANAQEHVSDASRSSVIYDEAEGVCIDYNDVPVDQRYSSASAH